MKRWIFYIAAVALFAATPSRDTDIASLAPVEVVWLTEENGQVYLETDTGDMGWGTDVRSALKDMKAAAPGSVFLETADYLIIEEGREDLLVQLFDVLRPSCKVCVARSMPDLEEAVPFLSAHEPQVTLRQYQVEKKGLPLLGEQEGRFEWIAE